MGDYGGFKIARVQALNWIYEDHRLQLRGLVHLNTNSDEMEEWLKKEIRAHQDAMLRVKEEIYNIAFPDTGEKEANPEKYPSHRPSCPTDTPDPLHDIDPKQYW